MNKKALIQTTSVENEKVSPPGINLELEVEDPEIFEISQFNRISNLSQVSVIVKKNLLIKFRNYQTYIYSFGFPIIFTLLFYFIFGMQEIDYGMKVYDIGFAGMLIYAASFGTINAATSLTEEKQNGTLIRLDTTPMTRSKIFMATITSEAIFMIIQLIVMFIMGYGFMNLQWHDMDILRLMVGFIIIFIFGLSTLGVGVVISAYSKTADSSVGLSLLYVMPIVFLSGAMIPFESPIQYVLTPFWAYALFRQYVVLGHDWTNNIQVSSANPFIEEYLPIPLWGGLLIILLILFITLVVGILLFQRKTMK